MHFSLLFHNLRSLNLQTELLEACDWNNLKLEETINAVSLALDSMVLPKAKIDFSQLMKQSIIPALKKQNIQDNLISIIIKYMEHDAKFVAHILSLPEH